MESGIDRILGEAWERGVVLCGLSAGALCWFAGAVTPRCTPSAPGTPLPEAMSTPVAA